MEKIPFTEDLIDKLTRSDEYPSNFISETEIEEIMIEFAKLHVKQALKQASESADVIFDDGQCETNQAYSVDKDSILNSYPLDLIK